MNIFDGFYQISWKNTITLPKLYVLTERAFFSEFFGAESAWVQKTADFQQKL